MDCHELLKRAIFCISGPECRNERWSKLEKCIEKAGRGETSPEKACTHARAWIKDADLNWASKSGHERPDCAFAKAFPLTYKYEEPEHKAYNTCTNGNPYKVCEGCKHAAGPGHEYCNELDHLLTHLILQCVYDKRADESAGLSAVDPDEESGRRRSGALASTPGEADSMGCAREIGIFIVAAEITSCRYFV